LYRLSDRTPIGPAEHEHIDIAVGVLRTSYERSKDEGNVDSPTPAEIGAQTHRDPEGPLHDLA
jgi:hypothetical protein